MAHPKITTLSQTSSCNHDILEVRMMALTEWLYVNRSQIENKDLFIERAAINSMIEESGDGYVEAELLNTNELQVNLLVNFILKIIY